MYSVSRVSALFFCIFLISHSVFAVSGLESKDSQDENQPVFTSEPVSPVSAAIVAGMNQLSEPVQLEETVLFEFKTDQVIYTTGCFQIDLTIKDADMHYDSEDPNANGVLELTFYKHPDMKIGYNKMFVYYNEEGSIEHIEFGRTVYYF